MTDFNLATADKYQLKFYAKENYGIDLSRAMSEQTMRERIEKHCVENDIDKPVSIVEAKGTLKVGVKYATINVAKQEGKLGGEPIFVGVQGVGYTIPRGVDVEVPQPVVEVLKNAVTTHVTQDDEGMIHKDDVQTYPFSIVKLAA